MENNKNVQDYATSDSPVNDAFEGIVELCYQLEGYITSTGKWFWTKGDKQKEYQDIDLLAIGRNKTIIVSVSSNLKSKITLNKKGELNTDLHLKLKDSFYRVEEYLKNTKEYEWLLDGNREIERVVAIAEPQSKKHLEKINEKLMNDKIKIRTPKEIIEEIMVYVDKNKNLKIQHEALRLIQIMRRSNIFKKI